MKRYKFICFALACSFTVMTGNVHADLISQTGQFNSAGPAPYEVTPFDSNLGTLDRVLVAFSGVLDAGISFIFGDENYDVGLGLNFSRPPDVLPFFSFEGDGIEFTYQGKAPDRILPIPGAPDIPFPFEPLTLPSVGVSMLFTFSREREQQGMFGAVLNEFNFSIGSDTLPGFPNDPVQISASAPTGITGGTINYSDLLLLPNDLVPVVTETFGDTIGPVQGRFSGAISFIYDFTPSGSEPPVEPPVTTVPEPGTLALFGIGLVGMGLARRRRKV